MVHESAADSSLMLGTPLSLAFSSSCSTPPDHSLALSASASNNAFCDETTTRRYTGRMRICRMVNPDGPFVRFVPVGDT